VVRTKKERYKMAYGFGLSAICQILFVAAYDRKAPPSVPVRVSLDF
jgi:hypothetical protein